MEFHGFDFPYVSFTPLSRVTCFYFEFSDANFLLPRHVIFPRDNLVQPIADRYLWTPLLLRQDDSEWFKDGSPFSEELGNMQPV